MKNIVLVLLSFALLASSAVAATQQEIEIEKSRLNQWLDNKIRTCPDNKGCISRARDTHRSKMNMLMANPDAYFAQMDPGRNNRGYSVAASDAGMCRGNCGSDQGQCIAQCRDDGQCINRCAVQHGRCVSRCNR